MLFKTNSYTIANFCINNREPLLLITPDVHSSEKILTELRFFTQHENIPIHYFPDRETLPYDHFSAHEDITSSRLLSLYQLPHMTTGIIIVAINTLMQRLPPVSFIQQNSFVWKLKDKLNLSQLSVQLIGVGYHKVSEVMQHGEFAIRGAIIDIFPMGSTHPFRVELFDDEIDTIRLFDPETQCSTEKKDRIHLLPAHEYALDEKAITLFRQQWRTEFQGNPTESPVYQQISKAQPIGGIEYYLPLFFEKTDTLCDYLPKNTQTIFLDNVTEQADVFWKDIQIRYEQLRHDITRPLCSPEKVFTPINEIFRYLKSFSRIRLPETETKPLPELRVDHRKKKPLENLENFIASKPGRILICAESTGRREVMLDLLKKHCIAISLVDSWCDFVTAHDELALTIAPIDLALWDKASNIIVITETQLFEQPIQHTKRYKKQSIDADSVIKNLTELHIGSPVVHLDHGIGRYVGLEKITMDEVESEYLTLAYEGGDRIYVPIQSLHIISRYSGADTEHVQLNKLGTTQWKKAREKAAKQIHDVAAELLKIYSERAATPGFAFLPPNDEFLSFRQAFPFDETVDQRKAIDAVIRDMTSHQSMDRLVCGDVGFGKTEVAMQAAFLAIQGGKQVAMLVPTTLLANQHFQNFQDRFSQWPVKITVLSRLQTPKEQQEIISQLKNGSLDILIGTHKLLNEKISFKQLGLLIVDEEHRFGVKQKEKIKSLRAHVDILTLTATPIPRTLNQSMTGIRDLSIISTPPAKRLAIKTFVHEFDESLIREAILRETLRGGQVYFLHNDVRHMPTIVNQLKQIIPEVSIRFAHGQMPERQLEKTMSDFYHQRFQVLVASTIIESGIDIPSANTIIINNANQFGLAQLHQIRGRVGRSHHQAYAYLLIKNKGTLTKDAEKRLEAISELEDLGVGFQLATHDLEIRGAGELLGESQSGHLQAIGFSLYMELLDEAVKALKSGKKPLTDIERKTDPDIILHISALFPENFIHDVHTRLVLYKRLSACENEESIQALKSELIDRFGLLPDAAQNLFSITHLKIQAKKLGIQKIEIRQDTGFLYFEEKPAINPAVIINLIQKEYKIYQFAGPNTLKFKLSNNKPENRISAVEAVLYKFNG